MEDLHIRKTTPGDAEWIEGFTRDHWGSPRVVVHGVVYRPRELPGFVAESGGEIRGLLTYHVGANALEIVTLNSILQDRGVGTALLRAAEAEARSGGLTRLWLITTNDNVRAQGFFQNRGFQVVAVHPGAVEKSRKLKPEIPALGQEGIPIRDEVEMERGLETLQDGPRPGPEV